METLSAFSQDQLMLLLLIQLWELPWKGYALWRAAQNRQTGWFVALMLVHLAGLIDIIYIFYFSRPPKKRRTIHLHPGKRGDKNSGKHRDIEGK